MGLLAASAVCALDVDEAVPEVPPGLILSSDPVEMPTEMLDAPNEVWTPIV